MQELATFSIETDSTVLLTFSNGSSRRVPFKKLSDYICKSDVERVKAAHRLRTSFIDTHMPKARMILIVGVGAALASLVFTASGRALANLINHAPSTQLTPGLPEVARSLADPSVALMPTTAPAPEVSSTPKVVPLSVPATRKRIMPSKQLNAAKPLIKTPGLVPPLVNLVTPLPVVSGTVDTASAATGDLVKSLTPDVVGPVTDTAGQVLDDTSAATGGLLGGLAGGLTGDAN